MMNAGENHMAWFYEIGDSNKAVAAMVKGFATQNAAMVRWQEKGKRTESVGFVAGRSCDNKSWATFRSAASP